MNNGTGRREQFSPAEISKVLARYRQSGLGLVKFAQEQGIRPSRLHYWVYEKNRLRSRNSSGLAVLKPVFQELKVDSVIPPVDSWAAEVSLPGGLARLSGLEQVKFASICKSMGALARSSLQTQHRLEPLDA